MLSKDVVLAVLLSLLSEMSPFIGRHSAGQPKSMGMILVESSHSPTQYSTAKATSSHMTPSALYQRLVRIKLSYWSIGSQL